MSKCCFKNPILPGFYPDPSLCRVGEDYYMVCSSFVYFPGLPLFHSRDLIHWEQIGHGISSREQLDYKNCETSLGLWAPTIRFHEGVFYIINTFVSEGREERRDNFIITAKDPAGPWSKPVFIEGADGIDPSIFFDRDQRLWYCGNYIDNRALYEGHHGIYLAELDRESFQIKGERKVIWDGHATRSKWIEAPHIYFHNGYYYLLVAEGGTFTNHSVMMARSTSIDGEYEICPRNPILSHRHLSLHREISVVGHGELFETQKGEWWMVLLGVRPYMERHFNLGRETFLVPIVWEEDGWPRVDNASGLVEPLERRPALPSFHPAPVFESDTFESEKLSMMWNTIHPLEESAYSLKERFSFLRLRTKPDRIDEITTPAFIGRRQRHHHFRARTAMEFVPDSSRDEAGLVLIQDNRYFYAFTLTKKEEEAVLSLYAFRGGKREDLFSAPVAAEIKDGPLPRIYLTVCGNEQGYHFYYGFDPSRPILFFSGADATLLSSVTNEGFTGTYIGMYASSNKKKSAGYADFDWFMYEPE